MGFQIEAFHNRHVPEGQARVDAILSVTAEAAPGTAAPKGDRVLGFIVDTSGSMNGERIAAVKRAVIRAIELLDDRVTFFVVGFQTGPRIVSAPARATEVNKRTAAAAMQQLVANGGTAMSTGLAEARQLFEQRPDAIRQALFLTDGKNESEALGAVPAELQRCARVFQCDCWGVGTDWQVGEVQQIAQALMGRATLIPDASGIEAAFRGAMEKAAAKAFKDVRLRLWTPVGTQVVFVKQVNPTIDELTQRGRDLSPQVREYLTGAWAPGESRDFHVAFQVKPGRKGDEMLAARPSIAYLESGAAGWEEREHKPPEARVFATWTSDGSLSGRIDQHVSHYAGQDELATSIERGLEARERGNEVSATQLLGRAVQLAHQSQNAEMTQRLNKVVDVVDAVHGTVRLKSNVAKAAAMELQLESRTTRRSRLPGKPEGSAP